jgi:hypothetical protein
MRNALTLPVLMYLVRTYSDPFLTALAASRIERISSPVVMARDYFF